MSQEPIVAKLVGNRIVVWNPEDGVALYSEGYYGQPLGIRKPKPPFDFKEPLELSVLEAYYLAEKGRIIVLDEDGKQLSLEELRKHASRVYEMFDQKYRVYRDLRDRGYIVRPGIKFGADFAVYKYGPGIDHAPFLVHVLPNVAEINAIEIVRAGRLAQSVRKKFIIATIEEENKVRYYMFTWFRA